MTYHPPLTITPVILNLVADISEQVGRLSVLSANADLRLRRIARIRTIQGSLAIEGNTLSEAQITAILNGKPVIAPQREVQEVKNALAAYEQFEQWQANNEADLLAAHAALMMGLVDAAGQYRTGGVGVMSGKTVIHMAPPANQVPRLMHDLMHWLATSELHPLIRSAVFHYEFEFIHPFSDGNGRLGRLWQSKILAQWHPLFANMPVETMVFAHQADYYAAIAQSTAQSDNAPFVEFMLGMIRETLDAQSIPQVTPQVTPQVEVVLLILVQQTRALLAKEIQALLGLTDRKSFRIAYLKPALAQGLVEYTLPDKPTSSQQRYRLTEKGIAVVTEHLKVNAPELTSLVR